MTLDPDKLYKRVEELRQGSATIIMLSKMRHIFPQRERQRKYLLREMKDVTIQICKDIIKELEE